MHFIKPRRLGWKTESVVLLGILAFGVKLHYHSFCMRYLAPFIHDPRCQPAHFISPHQLRTNLL